MNESSIKARLKNIADAEGRKFDELFKQLTFERFLARVANSKFRPNMIFKGGVASAEEKLVTSWPILSRDFSVMGCLLS